MASNRAAFLTEETQAFALPMAVQPGTGADCLQRPLRSRFRQRLTTSVRLPPQQVEAKKGGSRRSQRSVLCRKESAMYTTIGPIHSDRRSPGGRRERPLLWLRTVGCLVTLACSLLVAPCTPEAQPAKQVHRIGLLNAGSPLSARVYVEAFQQGLRALGYVEGQNMVIEYRYAEGQAEQLPELAAELVRLEVEVIVAAGAPTIRAAQHATRTIPIVMAGTADAVAQGFIASLARPGGNITGLSGLGLELHGKRLELLKETVPQSARIAVLTNPASPYHASRMHNLTRGSPDAGGAPARRGATP